MSQEISKWSDSFMFRAEDSVAADGPKVFLLGGPNDPLGQIAACGKMYKGQVVRDLRDVTDAERLDMLTQIQKTVLKMPLEAVSLHFMIEGVTRGFTHQMVRQRTAAYAQESTRFAVKEDMKQATALPPSLEGTFSIAEWIDNDNAARIVAGLEPNDWNEGVNLAWQNSTGAQKARLRWDQAVDLMGDAYLDMVNEGIPAEDARGLLPTNITTRLNYITNLRSWYETMAVRVSDQAQFEWRKVAMYMALALRSYGQTVEYEVKMTRGEAEDLALAPGYQFLGYSEIVENPRGSEDEIIIVRRSSAWQYEAISNELKPIEFKIGGPAFGADFDRPSRIGERVFHFHKNGVPSDQWTTGSVEHGIPPIHPNEWLLDPNSARLSADQEFDIFGNRVTKGTGLHMVAPGIIGRIADQPEPGSMRLPEAYRWPRDFVGEMPTMDNKPGVDEETLNDLKKKMDGV